MASVSHLRTEQARAQEEAVRTIAGLLGEESPRLNSARRDVVGRTMPDYVFTMELAELVRVVAAQQERIDALEKAQPRGAKKK